MSNKKDSESFKTAAKPNKVLITTSGIGSRLGDFTTHTNKSLVKVGDKLALSRIIEIYPEQVTFVITLGHFGAHVKDFLQVAYPNRKFEFVDVLKYKGPGSSLGFSMLCASKYLQEPFIYHASDTLLLNAEMIEMPVGNWVAGSQGASASQYASLDVSSGTVMNFHDKGMMQYDFLHIGLIGVSEYLDFWATLKLLYESDPNDASLNDLAVLTKMKSQGSQFKFVEAKNWIDMGNTESLLAARKQIGERFEVLEKTDESISFIENSVIKFFSDELVAKNRVERAGLLSPLTPEITRSKGNFYRYDFVDGVLASNRTTPDRVNRLLRWAESNLWESRDNLSFGKFQEICKDFYKSKSYKRIDMFLEKTKFDENRYQINGSQIPSIFELLESIDFNWLSNGIQSQFHGDFILDNIIETNSGFKLIDWRQDFGGTIAVGDQYYDLAKLNHSLVINHEIVNNNNFEVEIDEDNVHCEILRKHELVESTKELKNFIEAKSLDYKKVQVLTSLIWLNMAPLHHHPFDLFLFNFGKLNLWRALGNDKS
jgi:choline kinase